MALLLSPQAFDELLAAQVRYRPQADIRWLSFDHMIGALRLQRVAIGQKSLGAGCRAGTRI